MSKERFLMERVPAKCRLFLITKELAGATSSSLSLRIAKFASVGILPLIMAFAVIVVMKIVEVLA